MKLCPSFDICSSRWVFWSCFGVAVVSELWLSISYQIDIIIKTKQREGEKRKGKRRKKKNTLESFFSFSTVLTGFSFCVVWEVGVVWIVWVICVVWVVLVGVWVWDWVWDWVWGCVWGWGWVWVCVCVFGVSFVVVVVWEVVGVETVVVVEVEDEFAKLDSFNKAVDVEEGFEGMMVEEEFE